MSELPDPNQNDGSSPRPAEVSNAYYNFQNSEGIPKYAIKIENLSDIILKGDAAKNRFEKEFEVKIYIDLDHLNYQQSKPSCYKFRFHSSQKSLKVVS